MRDLLVLQCAIGTRIGPAAVNLDPTTHASLRELATRVLRGERPDHTLAPTDLVHEAWLRLANRSGGSGGPAADGAPDRLFAARVMRQVLVDHARRRAAAKREGNRGVRELDPDQVALARDEYVVALDGALAELAESDPELAAVVDLRFFGGLSVEETAAALATSPRTVKRRWQVAKAWLHREIAER
jgi:RNA polymerase sigma factor (TIGR02999 family)